MVHSRSWRLRFCGQHAPDTAAMSLHLSLVLVSDALKGGKTDLSRMPRWYSGPYTTSFEHNQSASTLRAVRTLRSSISLPASEVRAWGLSRLVVSASLRPSTTDFVRRHIARTFGLITQLPATSGKSRAPMKPSLPQFLIMMCSSRVFLVSRFRLLVSPRRMHSDEHMASSVKRKAHCSLISVES